MVKLSHHDIMITSSLSINFVSLLQYYNFQYEVSMFLVATDGLTTHNRI